MSLKGSSQMMHDTDVHAGHYRDVGWWETESGKKNSVFFYHFNLIFECFECTLA